MLRKDCDRKDSVVKRSLVVNLEELGAKTKIIGGNPPVVK
jgi:hypothetical protein